MSHSRAEFTLFRLTRNGVRAKSFCVGLHGPVNRIAKNSSISEHAGGRASYIFAVGDWNAMALAFIFLMPDAILMAQVECWMWAMSNFSTNRRQDNWGGIGPIHKPFAKECFGILPFFNIEWQTLQTCVHVWSRTCSYCYEAAFTQAFFARSQTRQTDSHELIPSVIAGNA
jgi:hypothetical protein